jgi:signal transduction histidine kinase
MRWLLLVCLLCLCSCQETEPPRAIQGHMDLRAWELNQGLQLLSGEWRFIPEQPGFQPGFIKVPSTWDDYFHSHWPVQGKARYELTIRLPSWIKQGQMLQLLTDSVGNRFTCRVNGRQVGASGRYALAASPPASRMTAFVPFNAAGSQLELVCDVENQEFYRGGLIRKVWLGTTEDIAFQRALQSMGHNLVLGVLLFLAVYHLIFFVQRRQDRFLLWFSLLCIVVINYLELFISHNLEYLFGTLPFDTHFRLLRLTVFLGQILFALYLRELFPRERLRGVTRYVVAINMISIGLTLVLPGSVHGPLLWVWWLFMISAMGVWIQRLALLWLAGRPESRLIGFTTLLHLGIVANDFLNDLDILKNGYYGLFGFIIFCLGQAALLSWRFNQGFERSAQLSLALQRTNLELEQRVQERTQALAASHAEVQALYQFRQMLIQTLIHDLKNPLSVILNLPRRQQVPAELVETLRQAGGRMLALVQNALDVDRLESQQLELSFQRFLLAPAVSEILDQLRPWGETKGLILEHQVTDALWVWADPQLLDRILLNLMTNAMKHTPTGGRIAVYAFVERCLYIEVRDNGRGIAQERLAHVFERLAPERHRDDELPSSGLGLHFCRLAVEAMGGEISLRSIPAQGTTVTLTLPLPAEPSQVSPMGVMPALDAEARALLAPYLADLQRTEIFEISALRQQLKNLETFKYDKIQAWINEVKAAADTFNEERYRVLLALVAPTDPVDCG